MTAAEMDIIIGANTQQAVDALRKLGFEMKQAEKTASNLSKKAGKDFTGLSRVIQDLPFGFTAISNNLTQLLPAAGAAGLAFSAIVSAVTFAQVGFRNWTRGISDNTKEVNINTIAERENAAAIKETYKAAGQQYAQVAKLIEQSKLQVTTREQQKKILEDLKSINQEYFGNLKVEGDAITGLNAAYEAYGNNILKVARAKGAAEAVEKLTAQLLATKDAVFGLDSNFTSLNLTFDKAGKFLQGAEGANAFEKIANSSQRVTDILAKGALPTFEDIAFLAAATGKSERDINLILLDRQKLKTKEAQITAQIASNSKLIAANEIGSVKGIKDKIEKTLSDFFLVDTNIKDIPKKFIDAIAVETGNAMDLVQKELDKKPLQVPLGPPPTGEMNELSKQLTSMLNNSFVAIGESIGNVMSGVGNPFSSFFSIVGEGLKAIGKQLIELGGLAVIVRQALKSIFTNPALAIAAGIAAIALGTVIANKADKIKGFATGGVVTKPTLALVGEQGPERITPLGYENSARNAMQGEFQFRISGRDLVTIIRRQNGDDFNTF